eukprot:CAMPEP_0202001890 /NCGR_PEP_ID=MMETSP0905-20130828/7892_1 /ASSEMBLY_ACC=CAM_ASM_000554 /TAXON_ID=420261 /ORGANISM="Thalassiosira antarctica, Strain CCMP982" /LENGTH=156 /DNA_ID=CAMNT_0048558681 /DNA_START=92 /DNA_END=563 /DNA_ORIENTATION=+
MDIRSSFLSWEVLSPETLLFRRVNMDSLSVNKDVANILRRAMEMDDNLRDCMLEDCMEWADYAFGFPLGCSDCCYVFWKNEAAVAAASDAFSSALDTSAGKCLTFCWEAFATAAELASVLVISWMTAFAVALTAVAVDSTAAAVDLTAVADELEES